MLYKRRKMMDNQYLVCSRCDAFIGNEGLELCPVCGHDMNSGITIITEPEENEE